MTSLITEIYPATDAATIKMVIRAQANDFFGSHDNALSICTLNRAHRDAQTVFKKYK